MTETKKKSLQKQNNIPVDTKPWQDYKYMSEKEKKKHYNKQNKSTVITLLLQKNNSVTENQQNYKELPLPYKKTQRHFRKHKELKK